MSEQQNNIEFAAESSGERLDKIMAARLDQFSRVQIQALIRDGQVTVGGRPAKPSYRVEAGDVICVQVPDQPVYSAPEPEAIPLDVLYEDDDLAVIDKPAGMVVHPAYGHSSGTLVNAVLARWPSIAAWGEPERAGIVHRLDKETSGVIVVAKTPGALDALRAQALRDDAGEPEIEPVFLLPIVDE